MKENVRKSFWGDLEGESTADHDDRVVLGHSFGSLPRRAICGAVSLSQTYYFAGLKASMVNHRLALNAFVCYTGTWVYHRTS